jgi:hypothetical protein
MGAKSGEAMGPIDFWENDVQPTEQCALKNANNYFNTNIYSHLETSGVQSYNLYLNVVHFFNTIVNKKSVIA